MPRQKAAENELAVTVEESGGEGQQLIRITIEHASRFVTDALAAGVPVVSTSLAPPSSSALAWQGADSSVISAFGYDESSRTLEVAFNNGVYRYYGVPADVVQRLSTAESKGRYLRREIIDVYPFERKRLRRVKRSGISHL